MWYVKDAVRQLRPYHLNVLECPVKVNQNENPYDVPESIKEEILRRLSRVRWCRYPPFVPDELHGSLGRRYGVDPDWVLAGNGSNEVLYATLAVCLEKGDRVIVPQPTFTLYSLLTRVFSAEPVTVPLESDFALDVDRLLETAEKSRAKVVCLCSPNNPTGRQYPRADVIRIIEQFRGLVMLDEAYVEFAPECLTDLVKRYDNVAVYRTFSKAFACAGLRIGSMIARPEFVREVSKGKLPYAINTFTTMAAIVACERSHMFAPLIDRLRSDREVLTTGLSNISGVHVHPSQANFVLVRLDKPVDQVFQSMVSEGILIRDVSSYPSLAGHIRISVGTSAEVERTIETLTEVMAAGATG